MRKLDKKTIEELGIPSRVLMERAGVSVVMSLEQEIGDLSNLSFLVVVGKGNNGGDGLVVARNLLDFSFDVTAILLSRDLKGDPLENLKAFEKLGGNVLVLGQDIDIPGFEKLAISSDVIVDAILGIGLKGNVRENVAEIIEIINQSPAYKVCVDISSGIDSDTGKVMGAAVKCDLTVTFAFPKIGHILPPGRQYSGKLKVASIGIPKIFGSEVSSNRFIFTESMAKNLLPERPQDSNKGTFGKVAIIAGSRYYTGAPVLAALGAMRSGCGLTYLLTPEPFNTVATTHHPDLISIPVPGCEGFFCKKSLEEVMKFAEVADAVAIGPGLSREEGVKVFVNEIALIDKPLVIDADGINNLTLEVLKKRSAPTILTPHPGEFARLIGEEIDNVKYNYELAESFAKDHECVLVLKGNTTIITDGNTTLFNLTGNSALAKGGSGDVLTGMIVSFLAQGLEPLHAAALSVYLHGLTANAYEGDEATMSPLDIPDILKSVIKKIRNA